MTETPTTLNECLDFAVFRDGTRPFLRCAGRFVTAAEIQSESHSISSALADWGIEPGDRVAVMMENVPEFLSVWFGTLGIGAVEVPVHTAHRGPLLEHILRESGARILFCESEFVGRLDGLDLPALERVVIRGEVRDPATISLPRHDLIDALSSSGSAPAHTPKALDASCILYTSGTTGPSKGVVLTHSANLWLARSNIELMAYTPDDVLFTAFPLFHVNAKCTSVLSALLSGADLVLDDHFSASRFWDRMREEGVTSFNYMGSMLSILAKQTPGEGDREHWVDRAYGGACPPELWPDFEARFGIKLFEHYGMTEAGIITWNTESSRRVGSIGRPAPYFEVRLADQDDREVAPGEVGEIQVRPNEPGIILKEYWNRPDANLDAFRNLWLHTGDRARMDEDGFLFYVDRIKDSIRRRGENISSHEVEAVVRSFGGVSECAAYGVPSDLGEDEVMVAVVPEDGGSIDPDSLIEHCRSELAGFAVPRYLRFVEKLPRNSSHRVEKYRLRDQAVTPDTLDFDPRRV